MFSHIFQLVRFYRYLIMSIIAGVTTLVVLWSLLLLATTPLYKATTTITIQPTDTELSFTRQWLGASQYNPSNILVQTHVEKLMSRPVAKKALAIMEAKTPEADPAQSKPKTKSRGSKIKRNIRKLWNTLNYGEFIIPSDEQVRLTDIRQAIDIEYVEGSYILILSVKHPKPDVAALAANSLAEAYIQQRQDEYIQISSQMDSYLTAILDKKNKSLKEIDDEEIALRRRLSISDLDAEKVSAQNALNVETEKLNDSLVRLSDLKVRISSLQAQLTGFVEPGFAQKVKNDIAVNEASIKGLEEGISNRRRTIARLDRKYQSLSNQDETFAEFAARRGIIQADVEDIRNQKVQMELANLSRVGQVSVINPAVAPIYPFFPKVLIFSIIGFIASVVISMFAVTALDLLNPTIKTSEDLKRAVGRNSLGALPTPLFGRSIISKITGLKFFAHFFYRRGLRKFGRHAGTILPAFSNRDTVDIDVRELNYDLEEGEAVGALTDAITSTDMYRRGSAGELSNVNILEGRYDDKQLVFHTHKADTASDVAALVGQKDVELYLVQAGITTADTVAGFAEKRMRQEGNPPALFLLCSV